jgi:hypothetical protein
VTGLFLFIFSTKKGTFYHAKIKNTIFSAQIKARCFIERAKTKLTDTTGEGHVDVAVKIIIGVVIGALVLAVRTTEHRRIIYRITHQVINHRRIQTAAGTIDGDFCCAGGWICADWYTRLQSA